MKTRPSVGREALMALCRAVRENPGAVADEKLEVADLVANLDALGAEDRIRVQFYLDGARDEYVGTRAAIDAEQDMYGEQLFRAFKDAMAHKDGIADVRIGALDEEATTWRELAQEAQARLQRLSRWRLLEFGLGFGAGMLVTGLLMWFVGGGR